MQVNVNDYLDIYCPHYNDTQRMVGTGEQYVLYMVSYRGYRNCDPQLGFKRWECNRPHAPHAPIKFSEKFQRYSAFSLGYEFHVGQEYYYICEWSQTSILHCEYPRPLITMDAAVSDYECTSAAPQVCPMFPVVLTSPPSFNRLTPCLSSHTLALFSFDLPSLTALFLSSLSLCGECC
ncbi:hypothetical protein GOODEAATRI_007996 [Goodea atripinnis]|uniref:Ephrin RBD domain-containing protein n=1 Tax=Goodea atripinnis TaxID=208336 RepID=A0ABV0MZL1_9TELE